MSKLILQDTVNDHVIEEVDTTGMGQDEVSVHLQRLMSRTTADIILNREADGEAEGTGADAVVADDVQMPHNAVVVVSDQVVEASVLMMPDGPPAFIVPPDDPRAIPAPDESETIPAQMAEAVQRHLDRKAALKGKDKK